MRYSSSAFLTPAVDGNEWSASRRGRALSPEKGPWYPLDRRLHGPQSRSGHRGYRKNPLPLSVIKHRSPFTPGERTQRTHLIGGWVDPKLVWTQRLEKKSFFFIEDRKSVAVCPRRKGTRDPCDRRLDESKAGLDTEARRKILCLCRGSPSLPARSQTLYLGNYPGSQKVKQSIVNSVRVCDVSCEKFSCGYYCCITKKGTSF
jgi:hypothetical protein